MRPKNEREVYERADDALAKMNKLGEYVDGMQITEELVEEVKHDLEIIRRRSDPAR